MIAIFYLYLVVFNLVKCFFFLEYKFQTKFMTEIPATSYHRETKAWSPTTGKGRKSSEPLLGDTKPYSVQELENGGLHLSATPQRFLWPQLGVAEKQGWREKDAGGRGGEVRQRQRDRKENFLSCESTKEAGGAREGGAYINNQWLMGEELPDALEPVSRWLDHSPLLPYPWVYFFLKLYFYYKKERGEGRRGRRAEEKGRRDGRGGEKNLQITNSRLARMI